MRNGIGYRRLWRGLLVSGLFLLIAFASVVTAGQMGAHQVSQPEWSVVFTDTFTVESPIWSIVDESQTGYMWGRTAYTSTIGSDSVSDFGLWAAGGGPRGSVQSWSTGTYTNGMQTIAVAGPFTMPYAVADVRLSARILNHVESGDSVFVELSKDGVNPPPDWKEVPSETTDWQAISRTSGPLGKGDEIYIFLFFFSDSSSVNTGPLIDDVVLEVLPIYDVYLPLVRLDPTPTPMPIYTDDFSNSASGWYVGEATRINNRGTVNKPDLREEVVAHMRYDSHGDGHYNIYVPMDVRGGGDAVTWFVWPAEMAPLPDEMTPLADCYSVETRARFRTDADYSPWWGHWGIVFGANAARTDIYTFQINANHKLGMLRLYNYTYPGDRQPLDGEQINVELPIYRWPKSSDDAGHWSGSTYGGASYLYKTLKVVVDGTQATFFINGDRVASADVSGMPRDRVGVIAGSWEVTPIDVIFDYFRYDATCSAP